MGPVRALTVRQPWAWAIVHGGKDVENRTRNIAGAYRGPVAIHAGKGWADAALAEVERLAGFDATPGGFVLGNIVGVVDLVHVHADCTELIEGFGHTPTCSRWAMSDHWHLHMSNPRPLTTPIPATGRLGLWTLPDDIASQITEQIGDDL